MSVSADPISLILDTDMGNDIDDALALAMIHTLQAQGECRLLGVTTSKGNRYAPMYVDIINTFYGCKDVPIGQVLGGVTPEDGLFIRQLSEMNRDGKPLYPRSYDSEAYPDAVELLRKTMSEQPDQSVVVVMIGFSTNMARLLETPPDNLSEYSGHELFRRKVRRVVMMAADFAEETKQNPTYDKREFNVIHDTPSAKHFVASCPSPIIFSGFEIGSALMYPGVANKQLDSWAESHPVSEAYRRYKPMPYDRPSWDLTAVLEAVRPGAGYFGLSETGTAVVEDSGIVRFEADPLGKHRHLTLPASGHSRIIDAMVELVTKPALRGEIHVMAKMPAARRKRVSRQDLKSDAALAGGGANES